MHESVFECLKIAEAREVYGASVNVIHTWGELLDWHPHIHLLVAWAFIDIPTKVFQIFP